MSLQLLLHNRVSLLAKIKSFLFKVLPKRSCPHLENEAIIELWVRPRAPGLGLARPSIIREKPELHQCHIAMETGREIPKAEQGDDELLAAVPVLHRKAEAGGNARWRGHHLIQMGVGVQTGQHCPNGVPF